MSRYSRRGSSRFAYLIEFIIIIAGIMVSFVLNEWRENKNIVEKKLILLQEIQKDLSSDSLYLNFSYQLYKEMHKSHDSLLLFSKEDFNNDSLTKYMDHLVSYFAFKPSERAYINLTNSTELFFDVSDTSGTDFLINRYLVLRKQLYSTAIGEWELVDKNFVLNTALPYLEQNAPYMPAPAYKSFDGEVYHTVSKDDYFKNIVKSGSLYKSVLEANYALVLKNVNDLNQRIRGYLSEELHSK